VKPIGKMKGVARLLVLVVVLCGATAAYLFGGQSGKLLLVRWLSTESTVRSYGEPGPTHWRPEGVRRYSSNSDPNARPATFGRALHTDLHGSDEIATAIAPMFELDWTAESTMFNAEGPVFDSKGNVYFSPLFPPEDVIVVSLDAETGKRRWVLGGNGAGGGIGGGAGTPLIIEDPDLGVDRIYAVTYERAVAADIDGNILWDVALDGSQLDPFDSRRHCYGSNYHIQSNSIVGVMGDGLVQVLDRNTGESRLVEPFLMPGAPTAVTSFSLPSAIAEAANRDIAHMYPAEMASADPISSVLHGAAGELQQVTNFFSIDSNSGRIWIASTLPDEADGVVDGYSDYAGLFGLDLIADGDKYRLDVAVVAEVPGGTASTPAVSADGERVYIADAYDTVYAIDASTGKQIWSHNVGDKVTGSLDISADNGEVYANTRTGIKKLFDRGEHAELAWTAKLDMYDTGRFQSNFKSLGAEIGANGIAFTGAVGIVAGKQKFPFKVGAGLIDRETGEIRYFVDGAEDSVSSMVIGPDGGLYVGNSPLRRVLGRATFGKQLSPKSVVGGVTRFKPVRYDLFLRDALQATANRATNAASIVDIDLGAVAADIFHIGQLLDQCRHLGPSGLAEGSLDAERWSRIERALDEAQVTMTADARALVETASILNEALKELL
jgi:outer membrane protein assembly factor BamB